MSFFHQQLETLSPVATTILSVAVMLFFGFAMTRVTKLLRLPNVTAYIVAGVLIGPYVLDLVPTDVIDNMGFIADIALAFIAFSTGEFFRVKKLKQSGLKVIWVSVLDTGLAALLVFLLTYYVLQLHFVFALVLAALAAATAPASTLMTIRQLGAKGDFVDTLLQVVVLDNIISLVAYSITISLALGAMGGGFSVGGIVRPILLNLGVLLLGGLFGWLMKILMPQKRTTDNRLIIAIATLFTFCGICALVEASPLLGCMSMGMVYINLTDDDKIFKQLNYWSPPILLLFFVRSGAHFKLDVLFDTSRSIGGTALLWVAILYFLVRIVGKYGGAFLGALLIKKPPHTRNFLGLALVPQAGVVIGLAALGARTLGGMMGESLETIILASSILYELVGPGCAKIALYFSGSYSSNLDELTTVSTQTASGESKSSVQLLIERLDQIQQELPKRDLNPEAENEAAFMQAAEEQYQIVSPMRRHAFLNRRKW